MKKACRVARPLPGRAGGYPASPPTDPYVRNERIRFFSNQSLLPLWRITVLPCKLGQMLWTILGMGKG